MKEPISPARVDDMADLKRLMEKATPGPWFYRPREGKHGGAWIADHPERGKHTKIIVVAGACYSGSDDYELIAALRNAAPELIAAAEALDSLSWPEDWKAREPITDEDVARAHIDWTIAEVDLGLDVNGQIRHILTKFLEHRRDHD